MNIAGTILLTARSGIGSGWWIGMAVCMLFMAVMMFGMMGHGRARDGWTSWRPGRWPGSREETPIDVLERRFAEGQISVEDYRQRREPLTNGIRHGQVGEGESERQAALEATREDER